MAATGTSELHYQWWVGNAVLSGATTSSYTASALALGDDGSRFSVQVTDAYGQSVRSEVATLTVVSGFTPAGNMRSIRSGHVAVLLPSGKVLFVGGSDSLPLSTAELYDPAAEVSRAFSDTGAMTAPRSRHTATLLADGTVLVTGGAIPGFQQETPASMSGAEIYDPSTGLFTATGAMNRGRFGHTATLLQNGTVLVVGGTDSNFNISDAELYDPATQTFAVTGALTEGRANHTATLLGNGIVVVQGGILRGPTVVTGNVAGDEQYRPDIGAFGSYGPAGGQVPIRESAVLLPNGKILLAGGYEVAGGPRISTASAVLYRQGVAGATHDPTGSMSVPRSYFTATRLQSGKILIAGGMNYTGSTTTAVCYATVEVYDPETERFTPAGTLSGPRCGHSATLLSNGKVLIAGGSDSINSLTSAELYDPSFLK